MTQDTVGGNFGPIMSRQKTLTDEIALWQQLTKNYNQKVFSFTSFEAKRRLISHWVHPGTIVDLGSGPLTLLLQDLVRIDGAKVIASDFCLDMLLESRASFRAPNLTYLVADNRALPVRSQSVDIAISVNSFLPESRTDVDRMFSEAARILRPEGGFIAVLPAFEMSLIARDKWAMQVDIDETNHREYDTTGWQCFYTKQDIDALMQKHKFSSYDLIPVIFDSPEQITHTTIVYKSKLKGVPLGRLAEYPLFEHFLLAKK